MGIPANKFDPDAEAMEKQNRVISISIAQQELMTPVFVRLLDKINVRLNKGLAWIAGASLMLMMFVVVGNSISRVVYVPFAGATEIVGWLSALTTAFALGYTQLTRGFVDIDALVERFPMKVQRVIKVVVDALTLCFFAMTAWKMVGYAFVVAQNGNLSETMAIPFYPLIILVAVGFFGLTLAVLVDLLKQLFGGEAK